MLADSASARQPERRKIRKGTQSCWQCKHRKVRCIFTAPHTGICNNCRRRGTVCIGQQYPDTTAVGSDGSDRIDRVEARVRLLAESINISGIPTRTYDHRLPRERGPTTTQSSTCSNSTTLDDPADVECVDPLINPDDLAVNKHDTQTKSWHSVWPSSVACDAILAIPVNITWCLRGLMSTPICSFATQDMPSSRQLLEPPSSDSNVAVVSQKLLLLGLYLQSVPPVQVNDVVGAGLSYQYVMSNAVQEAKRLVNLRGDLIQSVEGIECLALESLYRDNSGDVRPAWLLMRQALSTAQMLGFHRPLDSADEQPVEKLEHIWFRIVQADRYLSLILGLPQGCSESVFAIEKVVATCSPTERLRRLDCVATGRILDHKDQTTLDHALVRDLDELLRGAASTLELSWWLMPQPPMQCKTPLERFRETNRIVDQLVHFHLLARLHFPYLVHAHSDRRSDYSKMIAVNAARDALARALLLYEAGRNDTYCRGMHYAVLLFVVIICVAHVDSASRKEPDDEFTPFRSLLHQRPTDRGMLECALELLELLARLHGDILASRVATILSNLLLVEAGAASGVRYKISSSVRVGLDAGSYLCDNNEYLDVTLPTYGKIKIEVDRLSSSASPLMSLACESNSRLNNIDIEGSISFSSQDLDLSLADSYQSFLYSSEGSTNNEILEDLDIAYPYGFKPGS